MFSACIRAAMLVAGVAAPAVAQPSDPALPGGPLAFVGGGDDVAVFIDQARTARRSDGSTEVWTLVVSDPPIGKATFNYVRESFDCAGRSVSLIAAWGFDSAGQIVARSTMAQEHALAPGSIGGLEAAVVCDGKAPDSVVTGYRAALAKAEQEMHDPRRQPAW